MRRNTPRKGTISASEAISPDPTVGTESAVVQVDLQDIKFNNWFSEKFGKSSIIFNNRTSIKKKIFSGRMPSTSKVLKKHMYFFARYIEFFEEQFDTKIENVGDITLFFCGYIIEYLRNESGAAAKMRFFNRALASIGVDAGLLSPIPFSDVKGESRELITMSEARHCVKRAKNDASIVIRRHRLLAELIGKGKDPRRSGGGRKGDWNKLENRIWITEQVLKLKIMTEEEFRSSGFRTEIMGLGELPGAPYADAEGNEQLHPGFSGHLRWFYPSGADMLPFIVLFLIRTEINLAALAIVKAGRNWSKPYPFKLGSHLADDYVFISLEKHRGKQKAGDKPTIVKTVSPVQPWSYPFQILSFLEDLTKPLRLELERQLNDLHGLKFPTHDQLAELERLEGIKDDLIIYRTDAGITSLALQCVRSPPKWLVDGLKTYGLDGQVRRLRDVGLAFGYQHSGYNLAILQILGQHQSKITSALYTRRKQIEESAQDAFAASFGKSIALVRMGNFTYEALRNALVDQGLSPEQASNVLDEQNVTRFGNGCADPTNPPPLFRKGTAQGQSCKSQDCIDGCPWARWFEESVPHVTAVKKELEAQKEFLGQSAAEDSS